MVAWPVRVGVLGAWVTVVLGCNGAALPSTPAPDAGSSPIPTTDPPWPRSGAWAPLDVAEVPTADRPGGQRVAVSANGDALVVFESASALWGMRYDGATSAAIRSRRRAIDDGRAWSKNKGG